MTVSTAVLSKDQVIAYIGNNASKYNLDPAALLAVAGTEGLGHGPTPWYLPGEGGLASFGPPSWYAGGAGADFMKFFGLTSATQAAQVAWTAPGLDYWMKTAAADGGAGKTGVVAIAALVTGFERPYYTNIAGNITKAQGYYAGFKQQITTLLGHPPDAGGTGGVVTDPPGGNAIVPVPADSGGTSTPGTTTTSPGTGGTAPQDVKLGNVGPVDIGIPSGLVLGLFGMGLLALGALLFVAGGRTRVNVGTVGGSVRTISGSSFSQGYATAMRRAGR